MSFFYYQKTKFFRSYSFIPPYGTLILWVCIFYSYKNQEILPSYAASAIVLLVISSWLTFIIFNLESTNEMLLLFTQMNSKFHYLNIKMLFIFCALLPLIIFNLFYPAVTHRFAEPLSIQNAFLGFYINIIISLTGIMIGTFIKIQSFILKKYKWILLFLMLLLSITKFILTSKLPIMNAIIFFIPPVGEFLSFFNNTDFELWTPEFLILNSKILLYIFLYVILLNYIFKYTEYH